MRRRSEREDASGHGRYPGRRLAQGILQPQANGRGSGLAQGLAQTSEDSAFYGEESVQHALAPTRVPGAEKRICGCESDSGSRSTQPFAEKRAEQVSCREQFRDLGLDAPFEVRKFLRRPQRRAQRGLTL